MHRLIGPSAFFALFFASVATPAVELRLEDRAVRREGTAGRVNERPVALTGRLTVTNDGPAELVWDWSHVRLEVGGDAVALGLPEGELPGLGPRSLLRVGSRRMRLSDIPTSGRAVVPPGAKAEFPVAFLDLTVLDGLPPLTLTLRPEGEGEPIAHRIVEEGRSAFETTVEKFGPGGSAVSLTFAGRLDVFTAPGLVAEIARLRAGGAERVLVVVPPGAADPASVRWLVGTANGFATATVSFDLFPSLPAGLKGFAVAVAGRTGASSGTTVEAAATDLLRPVIDVTPAAALRAALDSADGLTRVAILTAGGSRLGSADAILGSIGDESGPIALAAITALGSYRQPAAVDRLVGLAVGEEPQEATAATRALAASRHDVAWDALRRLYVDLPPERRVEVLTLMAQHARPTWRTLVAEVAGSGTPAERAAALRALARIGHPRLPGFLDEAITADGPVAAAAGELLGERLDDPAIRSVAVRAAGAALAAGRVDAFVREVLLKAPTAELLDRFLAVKGDGETDRGEIVRLLTSIGTPDAVARAVDLWPALTAVERRVALSGFSNAAVAVPGGVVDDALASGDAILERQAVGLLEKRGDRRAVDRLAVVLNEASRPTTVTAAARALAAIGSPAAVDALFAASQRPDETRRVAADEALGRGVRVSSAIDGLQKAANRAQNGENWEEAVRAWDKVIAADPTDATAYSSRAHAYARLDRPGKAALDYRRAYELNPTGGNAITGVAIAAAQDPAGIDEAIAFVEAHSERLRYDNIFLYNVACVYGVAIRTLSEGGREPADRSFRPEPDAGPSGPVTERVATLRAAALDRLRRSVELGFDQFAWAMLDPDLATLRDDPAFVALMTPPAAEPIGE